MSSDPLTALRELQAAPETVRCSSGKRSYGSRRSARKALGMLQSAGLAVRQAYRCRECCAYHLSSNPKRSQPQTQAELQDLADHLAMRRRRIEAMRESRAQLGIPDPLERSAPWTQKSD